MTRLTILAAILPAMLLAPLPAVSAQVPGTAPPAGRTPINAELALRALRESFPDRVGRIAFEDGDWTVMVGNRLFFWSEGRLLPREERNNADSFGRQSFYRVPDAPRSPASFSPEEIEQLRGRSSGEVRRARLDVHRGFQSALYGGYTRREIEALQRRIQFLGFNLSVHRDIVAPLGRVEAEIRAWEGGAAFIATLGRAYGFSWRQIAETQRMSFHSWGLAVDILPRSLGNRAVYWLWEQQAGNANWMLIPLERRWSPPPQVVEAFRRNGFIWGGNWVLFDTMHFEFRPELLAYSRLSDGTQAGAVPGMNRHGIYVDRQR